MNVKETTVPVDAAHILVVDDSALNRKKISMAVETLGHRVSVAEDGQSALDLLNDTPIDAILLDIVMPRMDGFQVLETLKANRKLRDIPVVVISALEDERSSVIRAIELGAEDFLPKAFDAVMLNARLNASLSRKRFQDQEKEYFNRIEKLTIAAEKLEAGQFNPNKLDLDGLAAIKDPIGKLSLVFRGMAAEIYTRELQFRKRIEKLQGMFWLLAVGIIWGIAPTLSKMMSELGALPLGLVVWVNAIVAVLMLGLAAIRGELPRLGRREVAFFLCWALISGVLQRTALFTAAGHIEAALLAMVLTLQGFAVFAFAAVTRTEKATPRRLFGLAVGLAGVGLVMWTKVSGDQPALWGWLLFAMSVPLLQSMETVRFSARIPEGISGTAAIGLMMLMSAIMVAPMAYQQGELMTLSLLPGTLEWLILLLAVASLTSYLISFQVIRTSGAIFYSQSSFTMTIAGVIWGVVLLNEAFSTLAWLGFGVILLGMYLVEPKENTKELVINRSFR